MKKKMKIWLRTINASFGTEITNQHIHSPEMARSLIPSVLLTAFSTLDLKKIFNDTINI